MRKEFDKKLSAIDPRFRKKITDLFDAMHESVSLLYEAATHDEKTGLYNNKFFETILDMEIEKTKRGKERLCLMMLDIDFFKKINDKYGHLKADNLLERLASVLKNKVRVSDVVARFGGEELMILLPATTLRSAKRLAKRLQNAIHSDAMLKKHGLTVSGGITEFREKDNKKNFKQRVDKALYKAKNQGRDRFVVLE
ncbi:MAG: GGDEF domain-containing protein [Nanoarchaeota archaeon]